jgi:hypothetical protein
MTVYCNNSAALGSSFGWEISGMTHHRAAILPCGLAGINTVAKRSRLLQVY